MKQIKLFSILMMLVLCCGTVFAQGITITGTITDAKTSESLPGALFSREQRKGLYRIWMENIPSLQHRAPHW
nr:hypothetical protein [Parabacteroides goldsteinii]